jgi:hypothetical protein
MNCPTCKRPLAEGATRCAHCEATAVSKEQNPPPAPSPQKTARRKTVPDSDTDDGPAEPAGYKPSSTAAAPTARVSGKGRKMTNIDSDDDDEAAPRAARGSPGRVVGWMVSFDFNDGGQEFPLREGRNRIGRDRDNDICMFYDPNVSEPHAVIVCRGGKATIKDEMSTNGVIVNDEDIGPGEISPLLSGDVLRVGHSTFKVFLLDREEMQRLWPRVFAKRG